jgi:hypothetical protein
VAHDRKGNVFKVDLGSTALPDKVADRLNAAVQRAALDFLADLDLSEDIRVRFPPEWYGIWIELPRVPGLRQR